MATEIELNSKFLSFAQEKIIRSDDILPIISSPVRVIRRCKSVPLGVLTF